MPECLGIRMATSYQDEDFPLTKCVVCHSTQALTCGQCNKKRMQQTWHLLTKKRQQANIHRKKLDLLLKLKWESKTRCQKQNLLKDQNMIESLVSEIKELTRSIHSKRIQVREIGFNLEQRVLENNSTRNVLETIQTSKEILSETLLSELTWHMDHSMVSYQLQQWKRCLSVFSVFRLQSNGVASIMGMPLPSTIALWPSIPAPILGQSLSLACRLVTIVGTMLNIPLPHHCFAVCPIDGNGAWAGIGQQSSTYHAIHLLKPPWYCDNGLTFDDEFDLDRNRTEINSDVTTVESEEDSEEVGRQRENLLRWTVETGDSAFSTAVTLLQTSVLNLCIRAQVPMVDLHPETILANLAQLRKHIAEQAQAAIEEGGEVPLPLDHLTEPLDHNRKQYHLNSSRKVPVNIDMVFPNKEQNELSDSNQFEEWESVDRSVHGAEDGSWSSSPAWLSNVLPTAAVWDLASNLKGYQG